MTTRDPVSRVTREDALREGASLLASWEDERKEVTRLIRDLFAAECKRITSKRLT